MAGEDLNLKPSTVKKARFVYSPLGKIFNNGLKEKDKKEGLLKRLKNIGDEEKLKQEKLKAIQSKTENIKEVTASAKEPLNLEAKVLIRETELIQKDVYCRKLKITGSNKTTYDLNDYKTFKELFRDLYYKNMKTGEAERKQDKFDGILCPLSSYPTKKKEYIEPKTKFLNNAKNIYNCREKNIEGFKSRMFSAELFDYKRVERPI